MVSPSPAARIAYAGFAAFGGFWGVWGASVPAVREQAGIGDGQLGTALLFVGAGALPAMLLAGPAVDRWGHRLTASLLVALGGAGVGVAVTGQGFVSLSVGLAVVGAASGAVDVAINAAAGTAERATGRPVIGRAHGVFSASVVVASLGTGALRAGGAPVAVPFLLVAAAAGAAATVALTAARAGPPEAAPATGPVVLAARRVAIRPGGHAEPGDSGPSGSPGSPEPWSPGPLDVGPSGPVGSGPPGPPRPGPARPGRWRVGGGGLQVLPLLVVGGLGALAFAVENAHQSWSALYLGDVQSAGPTVAAAGPAVFAAVVALTRFAVAALDTGHPTAVLVAGAGAAAAGTALVAGAPGVAVAFVGLGLAAAGTAVLYPTLLGLVTELVDESVRGAATSVVATVAYLGFLLGPVYVGRWSAAVGLPGAMAAVAAVAAGLALLAWPALRLVAPRPRVVTERAAARRR